MSILLTMTGWLISWNRLNISSIQVDYIDISLLLSNKAKSKFIYYWFKLLVKIIKYVLFYLKFLKVALSFPIIKFHKKSILRN